MKLTPDLASTIDLPVFMPYSLDLHLESGITPGTLR
jgi:hypothetical protein